MIIITSENNNNKVQSEFKNFINRSIIYLQNTHIHKYIQIDTPHTAIQTDTAYVLFLFLLLEIVVNKQMGKLW